MSHVQVVLFVKGKGCDAASFRPQRDESQWWNRRDALVRCIAAFLFGPGSPKVKKSLVLLFDEDWARIDLELVEGYESEEKRFVPTEQNVIGVLRKAAEASPGTPVMEQALRATLTPSKHMSITDFPSVLDSKRDILEYLQKTCSMDFLRQHHLNSSTTVVLKKTNKEKLTTIWQAWVAQNESPEQSDVKEFLAPILQDILGANDQTTQTVAGILHESGDAELPIWNQNPDVSSGHRIVLFLGAVRDMLPVENDCVASVCREQSIRLVKLRLGQVAEFTSKILTIVAFHAANGMLWPSIQELVSRRNDNRKRSRPVDNVVSTRQSTLQVVLFVPMDTANLVTDLESRNRILWCLVRCCVVTLWRSKVHAGAAVSPLVNQLHLVFQNGYHVSIKQDELVAELAEQHQAAPCEFQILSALQKRMPVPEKEKSEENHSKKKEKVNLHGVAKRVVKAIRQESTPPFCIVSTCLEGTRTVPKDFYASTQNKKGYGTVVLVETVEPCVNAQNEFIKAFWANFTRNEIRCERDLVKVDGKFCNDCADAEAASITMMQHIAYQGCLQSTFEPSNSFKSAKKDVICGQDILLP